MNGSICTDKTTVNFLTNVQNAACGKNKLSLHILVHTTSTMKHRGGCIMLWGCVYVLQGLRSWSDRGKMDIQLQDQCIHTPRIRFVFVKELAKNNYIVYYTVTIMSYFATIPIN